MVVGNRGKKDNVSGFSESLSKRRRETWGLVLSIV